MSTTTDVAGAARRITDEVAAWPGVTTGFGRRGEFAFKLGPRELGHLHGDHAAHFAFPKDVCVELRAAGRIGPHPALPNSPGHGARRIATEDDVTDVIALMRLNYDRIVARHGVAAAGGHQ